MKATVLIVDDEPDIRELLEITLGRLSLATRSAENVSQAKALLDAHQFQLCLTDMRLPDGDGLELLDYIQSHHSKLPVAVITAHGNTETAIRALKAGAFDFVSKPINLQKLRDLIDDALRLSVSDKASGKSGGKAGQASSNTDISHLISGSSAATVQLREQILRVARSQAPVFISGQSGSGKERAARAIHLHSARREGPFVAVNCGAIPSELMESELFGHVKGSFTGADRDKVGLFVTAGGGTLFLDEVADLPLSMQVKLLRVIQEKTLRPVGSEDEISTNVRILSASHKSLAGAVEAGHFRQDLYYRINVIEVGVPNLAERKDDIPALADDIIHAIAEDHGTPPPNLTPRALAALQSYPFPGNIRELENILQRAITLCDGSTITVANLELSDSPPVTPEQNTALASRAASTAADSSGSAIEQLPEDFSLEHHLETIERQIIDNALQETRWNKTAAAKKLGLTFRALRYRLKKLGID